MGRARRKERNISTTTTTSGYYYYYYYRGTTATTGVLNYSNMWKNNTCFQTELNYFRSSTTTTTTIINYYHHSSSTTITISGSICGATLLFRPCKNFINDIKTESGF